MKNDPSAKTEIPDLRIAVRSIKAAILRSRYVAARLANAELLKLYFGVANSNCQLATDDSIQLGEWLLDAIRRAPPGSSKESNIAAFLPSILQRI